MPPLATAGPIDVMYGVNGGHNNGDSILDGYFVLINQVNGAVTPIGHPDSVPRLTGLAIDPAGSFWATSIGTGGFPPPPGPSTTSNLLRLDPGSGAQLSSVPITVNGVGIAIADLAVNPSNGVLYGVRSPQDLGSNPGVLYTINKTTGVATQVAATGHFFTSIAFAPNGTLYLSSADLGALGNVVNFQLSVLNSVTGAVISSVTADAFYGALGVRRSDSVIFGGTGDSAQLFTINPATGRGTLIGATGLNFVGDIDFTVVPEPGTLALVATALSAGILRRRKWIV